MKCGEEYWLEDRLSWAFEAAVVDGNGSAIDIGANAGSWTPSLAEYFDDVFAVEPDRRAADLIPERHNVHIIRKAAASHSDGVTFHFREESVYNSTLIDHPIGGGGGKHVPCVEERKVETITLDELHEIAVGEIQFVKIDIEGGEVEALKGATKASDWAETVFLVECHDTYDQVAAELGRLGHEVERIPHPFGAHPGHCWAISHA